MRSYSVRAGIVLPSHRPRGGGLTGLELARQIRAKKSRPPTLLLAGDRPDLIGHAAAARASTQLAQPCATALRLRSLRGALEAA